MSEALIPIGPVTLAADATVLHKPGAVLLTGYPLLVYAPNQYGTGIRTENNGTPVADIAAEVAVNPDYNTVAAKFGVTVDHVAQAVDFAVKAGFLKVEG
jgi:hypothetical protein